MGLYPRSKGKSGYIAHCPAHRANSPSLSLDEGRDGRVLMHCFTGCDFESITKAMGPPFSQDTGGVHLSAKIQSNDQTPRELSYNSESNITVQDLAEYVKLDAKSLEGLWNLRTVPNPANNSVKAVRIPYVNVDHDEETVQFRLALTGQNRFRYRKGDKPIIYNQAALKKARVDVDFRYVWIVEGASDVWVLEHYGEHAVGIPGASNWREQRDAQLFDGIDYIYVSIEHKDGQIDQGGLTVLEWLKSSSIRNRVHLVFWGDYDDPRDLHVKNPGNFKDILHERMEEAVPWVEYEQERINSERVKALEAAGDLATASDILSLLDKVVPQLKLVGERDISRITYLVFTSRVLDHPVNLAVKGPSSSGKSEIIKKVSQLFPDSALLEQTAFSEKALLYNDEPLKNRTLVIYEYEGIKGESQNYFVRSLLSEGHIKYTTVESTSQGNKPRHIFIEGPTGLVLTTTAINLHPENETRMLSVNVNDSPDQTAKVYMSMVDESENTVDLSKWIGLQEYIGTMPGIEVTIPYGKELASRMRTDEVRLRRDFRSVLSLIRAHTVLHQKSRRVDPRGRLIATRFDYEVVYDLIAPIISEGVKASVSDTIRETVEAVEQLYKINGNSPVSNGRVAEKLGIGDSASSRRVKDALSKGYIVNMNEGKKGSQLQLMPGELMPGESYLLPAPESLIYEQV